MGVNEQVASPQGSVNPTTPHLHNGINTPPSLPPPNVPPTTLNSPQIPESQPASPFANDNHPKSINHHIFLPLSLFFHTSLHTTTNNSNNHIISTPQTQQQTPHLPPLEARRQQEAHARAQDRRRCEP